MKATKSGEAIIINGTLEDMAVEFGAWISQIYNQLPTDVRAEWKGAMQMIMDDGSPVWELDGEETGPLC